MQQTQFSYGFRQGFGQSGCVATIGTFDGVHLGHQAILLRLGEVAEHKRIPSVVVIFEPQPQEYFNPNAAPARLMSLREKVLALLESGVHRVVCLKFDSHLRSLTAQQFIEQFLVGQLHVQHLEIGDDFRFGCDRQGDFEKLVSAGKVHGFSVCDTQTLIAEGERISSTRIRKAIERGEFESAKSLLGRPYVISGRVVYGRQLGRQLGVPTANLALGRLHSPVNGVYAVTVQLDDEQKFFQGVANVGVKPTLAGQRKPALEVHIFDFDQQIYGRRVTVEFKAKLRAEQKFASVDELQKAIQADIDAGRDYFLLRG